MRWNQDVEQIVRLVCMDGSADEAMFMGIGWSAVERTFAAGCCFVTRRRGPKESERKEASWIAEWSKRGWMAMRGCECVLVWSIG